MGKNSKQIKNQRIEKYIIGEVEYIVTIKESKKAKLNHIDIIRQLVMRHKQPDELAVW